MDGGSLSVSESGRITTVWRRELDLFRASLGEAEERFGAGKNPMMSERAGITHVVWQDGASVKMKTLPANVETVVGTGRLPQVVALPNGRAIVAWESNGHVIARRL